VQVEPTKPELKAPGVNLLKLKYDDLLSSFAFKSNLRRYSWDLGEVDVTDADFSEAVIDRYQAGPHNSSLLTLNSVSGLVSKIWYRIPFDQSELSISRIPPTDSPEVRPGRDP